MCKKADTGIVRIHVINSLINWVGESVGKEAEGWLCVDSKLIITFLHCTSLQREPI